MGAVYKVHDEGTGRELALKRLHGQALEKLAPLFEREYRTLAGLKHPRIVEVFEYGADEAGAFYTMELLEGADLARRAPMPWRAVCGCLRDAASILGVLHARQLVHRDLSPRNLWQTPDGRLKLLDFGALGPFGVAQEIVGTPAFIAPEALRGEPLDQRTDLFALGALGHFLLTGTHAYRAGSIAELTQAWERAPAAASSLAKLVKGGDAEVPPELDRLLLSLLSLKPDERPPSTADVIDQLNAIAGLTPESQEVVQQGYLESGTFVGRERLREQFVDALEHVAGGMAKALCVEARAGMGRTRLLAELSMVARMAGSCVVSLRAGSRPFETAAAIGSALLTMLPREARAAATPHAPVLAALSADLSSKLALAEGPSSSTHDALEKRLQSQTALTEWILSLARVRPLTLLVDDLHEADEQSQALLSLLARASQAKLLIVASLCSDGPQAEQPTLRTFRNAAGKLRLGPLTEAELGRLLRSVFGEAAYRERLAARLHARSEGNPSRALAMLRQLVASGVVRYAEGAWALPTELPEELVDAEQASVATFHTLTREARALLTWLALSPHAPLSRSTLRSLLSQTDAQLREAAYVLLHHHLVRETSDGIQIKRALSQDELRKQLGEHAYTQRHQQLATLLAAQAGLFAQARRGLHLLHAGSLHEGERHLLAVSRRIVNGERDDLRAMVPVFAEAYDLLRARGRNDYACIPSLNVLAIASYLVDRSYAARYGDQALMALQSVLRFNLARRLKRVLGAKLALAIALVTATVMMWARRSELRPSEVANWLVIVTGALMGPASLSLDVERTKRYATVFEPLLALGDDHAVSHMRRFCYALVTTMGDRCADAQSSLEALLQRMNDPRPVPGMTEQNRRTFMGAIYSAYGARQAFACDPDVLKTAALLEEISPMNAAQADSLRVFYYSYRGELERAKSYEQQVEIKAIQRGTTWQAELLAPRHLARLALWTHDAPANMRAARALSRLRHEVLAFAGYARHARAADLVLRGKYREALPLLERYEEPLVIGGWVMMRAQLARCYNALAQHEKARDVCLDALGRLSLADREFVIAHLPIEIELALAKAGLGAHAEARAELSTLLERHRGKGLLVVGRLHDALAQVALLSGDKQAAAEHVAAMDEAYRQTKLASLLALVTARRRALLGADQPSDTSRLEAVSADDAHLLTRLQLIANSAHDVSDGRLTSMFRVLLSVASADRLFVVLPDSETASVFIGDRMGAEQAIAWARERLDSAMAGVDDTDFVPASGKLDDPNLCALGDVHYRLHCVWSDDGSLRAGVVLGSAQNVPSLPPATLMDVVGGLLNREGLSTRATALPTVSS
jgi:hypothetical protein